MLFRILTFFRFSTSSPSLSKPTQMTKQSTQKQCWKTAEPQSTADVLLSSVQSTRSIRQTAEAVERLRPLPGMCSGTPGEKKTNTSSITSPLAPSLTLPITDSSLQYEQVFGSWWYWWQRFEVLYWPALWRPSTPLRVLHRPTLCTFSLENFHY